MGYSSARLGVAKGTSRMCYVLRALLLLLLLLWLIYTLNLRRNFIYKLLPKRQKLRLAAAAAVD